MYILKQLLRRIFLIFTAVLSDKAENERLKQKIAKRKDGGTVLFSESNYLGNHMAAAGDMFSYLAYFVAIIVLVCIIAAFLLVPIETQEDVREMMFLVTLLLDLFFVFGLYWMDEFGIHTFREVYIRTNLKEFCQTHAFMMIGLPFAMIGIGGELVNFVPLRVKLGKYKMFRF